MLIQNIGQINDVTPCHLMNSCKMLYKVVRVKKEAYFRYGSVLITTLQIILQILEFQKTMQK